MNDVLNPPERKRNLRSTKISPTRIRELIQEQKTKHEEQQDIVSKLQQELASLVEEEEHRVRGLELEETNEEIDNNNNYDGADRSLENLVEGTDSVVFGGKNNKAQGTGSVVNGGKGNDALGSICVIGGGLKNLAIGTLNVIGGGALNFASGEGSAIGGGALNQVSGQFGFIGGGSKNSLEGQYSVIGGGSKNKINAKGIQSVIGGGFKNKASGDFTFVGGGEKNVASKSWSSVLGGKSNTAKGNYASAMGRKAQANRDLCMAIGLDPDGSKSVRAQQISNWIVRASIIELCIGDQSIILDSNNIKKFKNILEGRTRRRAEATSEEERKLLSELEDYEELVDDLTVEMEELQGDIEDFHIDLEDEEDEQLEIGSE